MKKLFFFRSHSSSKGDDIQLSPSSTDKQVKKIPERADKSTKNKHDHPEDQKSPSSPCLRRSLSFSSGHPYDDGKGLRNKGDRIGSPYSNLQLGQYSSRSYTLTPERQNRRRFVDAAVFRKSPRVENFDSAPRPHSDTSEISSNCSSSVLDRYIDGEQQVERCELKPNFCGSNQLENGNAGVKRPPRFQLSAPVSRDARSQKPKSQSFRETKASQFQLLSKDGGNSEYIASPQKLAKHVAERLSQSQPLRKTRNKEIHPDCPITIEDVYGRTLNNRFSNALYTDGVSVKQCTTDWNSDAIYWSHDEEEIMELSEKESPSGDKDRIGENVIADFELLQKFKEAEERTAILSEELVNGNFLRLNDPSLPALIQTIRSLTEEKLNLTLEVSAVLEDRIAEKTLLWEKLKLGRVELEAGIRKLEKEKNELQQALETELDRRSTEWSLKLERYHTEEQRLRERIRELAEQNVSLQKEVCYSSERDKDVKSRITNSEKQLDDMSVQVKHAMEENHYLHKSLSDMDEKTKAAEEERDCIRRNYEEKITECKYMHQTIARLQRTCNDQEKTIAGLRELCNELGKNSQENNELGFEKLRVEHMRLTGVEHALIKEVEVCQVQVNSLRQENIDLLNRLKNNGNDGAFSTFKLDQELQNRTSCLQNQMFPLLMESSQLSRRLLGFVKLNGGSPLKKDSQFFVECEVKIQGLQREAENFAISMQTLSNILQEKLTLSKSHSTGMDTPTHSIGNSHNRKGQNSEETIRSALKAETLLTNLLRDKLYSKEQETEQLQAELAAAVRGNDILKSEVQNAEDEISCMNHKMKESELQMKKKEEAINQLLGELQDCKKELAVVRGVLPKVSEERDMMWEKVKQYSEDNMLLSGEIDVLRKKIDALDDEIMLKEGQISILKDSMNNPFSLTGLESSPDTRLQ